MNKYLQQYINMQRICYIDKLETNTLEECKTIIGPTDTFCPKNDMYYDLLFDNQDNSQHIALDFGCGIGRLMRWFSPFFKHIDGIDISPYMIKHAKTYLDESGITNYALYNNLNGYDINEIQSGSYDVVYSMWTLEHICVHEYRMKLFEEFWRVLKPKCSISIQMQGGDNYMNNSISFNWYDNYYNASSTNRTHDVRVKNLFNITRDLHKIGFEKTGYVIVPINTEDYPPPLWAGHQFQVIIKARKPL